MAIGSQGPLSQNPEFQKLLALEQADHADAVTLRKIVRAMILLHYTTNKGPLLEAFLANQGSQTNALAFAKRKE